jgi:hypothetical protein
LRELLPPGAVTFRRNNYVEVLMVDQEVATGGGSFPAGFINQLVIIHFISHVIAAAQEAHKRYGVPASVLIAKSMYDWGCHAALGKQAQRKKERHTSRDTKLDFLREAKRISRHPKYRLASPFIECRCEYTAKLCHYGIIRERGSGSWMHARDVIDHIVNSWLLSCDIPESGLTLEEHPQRNRREHEFEENFEKCRTQSGEIFFVTPRATIQMMPHPKLAC